ncbi:MAG: MBL fold metallo-hydrolase [Candidatus Zixiibacteriota bacterium]|nr:MAG: MBL fold metallo-hydrolase [candidate division Zixibacteria bacterium]
MRWDNFEVEKLKDIFYVVRNTGGANICLCLKNDSALVVDSGYLPKASAALNDYLRKSLGCEIKLLFNTHYHADHTFGNQSFDCPILSSEACRRQMEKGPSSFWSPAEIAEAMEEDPDLRTEWKELRITPPTMTFAEKKEYDFEGIEVVFQKVGGHTECSSMAVFPGYETVITGDLIFSGVYPTLLRDGNPAELVKALKDLARIEADMYIPGHGASCGHDILYDLIDYWSCLIVQCTELMDSGMPRSEIQQLLETRCRMRALEYDERKHTRNIDSVVDFFWTRMV